MYDKKQGNSCNPVLLLLDEAGRTAIPMLADQATTVVGRGISLWVAIQSLSQLETVYGRARAQVLRDNMESQLYYRPTDLATAQYLESRLGTSSAYAHSRTLRSGEAESVGLAERPIPLCSAQEILQLSDTEVIGFHRQLPPVRLTRMDWRTQPELQERRNIPAPQLPALPPIADLPIGNWEPALIDPDQITGDGGAGRSCHELTTHQERTFRVAHPSQEWAVRAQNGRRQEFLQKMRINGYHAKSSDRLNIACR